MKNAIVSSFLVIAFISGSINATQEPQGETNFFDEVNAASHDFNQRVWHRLETLCQDDRFAPGCQHAIAALEKAASVAVAGAAGAGVFYADHIKPLEEGANPEAGDSRIIFSAQFQKDSAFYEGQKQGGSVLGAMNKCLAKKNHYEALYGAGACERVKEYAPGHHKFESLLNHLKWYYFAIPAAVVGAAATATSVCVYRKLKRD